MPISVSDALKEAWATGNTKWVEYGTLELHHETLTTPARVCLGWDTVEARLESTAPVDASTVVTFTPAPIDVKPMDIVSGEESSMDLTLHYVTHDLITSLEEASEAAPTALTVYYRIFLSHRLDIGPEAPSPFKMYLRAPKVDPHRGIISGRLTYRTLANRSFPFQNYTPARFPGARRF